MCQLQVHRQVKEEKKYVLKQNYIFFVEQEVSHNLFLCPFTLGVLNSITRVKIQNTFIEQLKTTFLKL